MARAADQFRSSDVTAWGIVALCCWAAAVLLANIGGLVPANLLAGLHASRLEGGTINQLRMQVAELKSESDRMRRENNVLVQRLDLQQQAQNAVTRRVGALEVSLPQIVERLPETAAIDNSATASITDGKAVSYGADGGSVTVEHKPLIAIRPGNPTQKEAAAEPRRPDGSSFGVALGFPFAPEDAEAEWQDLMARVGTLLIGLEPVLTEADEGDGVVIVAGPIPAETDAAALCGRLDNVGIPCSPAPYRGEPLPLLN